LRIGPILSHEQHRHSVTAESLNMALFGRNQTNRKGEKSVLEKSCVD
jgi:hypothetical protein